MRCRSQFPQLARTVVLTLFVGISVSAIQPAAAVPDSGGKQATSTTRSLTSGYSAESSGTNPVTAQVTGASAVSVRQPALLPVSLIPGGHQAGGEHGGRSGQAFSSFCGSSTRLHGRVVTQPADSRHDGVEQGLRQHSGFPVLGHVSGSDNRRQRHVPASNLR